MREREERRNESGTDVTLKTNYNITKTLDPE